MTQHQQILNHFYQGKSLTVAQALNELGIYALSQRCTDLRREGYPVQSEWVESNGKRFKRYYISELPFVDRQQEVKRIQG